MRLQVDRLGDALVEPHFVGIGLARFIQAQRALAVGLVAEVVPDDQLEAAAQPWVDDLLNASPMGLRMTKEGLAMAIDACSLEAAMAIENRNQTMTAKSGNFAEGMRAFMEKRRPDFSKL